MGGLGALRGGRMFWLLVGLAVALLGAVSTTLSAVPPDDLLERLGRDIAALRIHLEDLGEGWPGESGSAIATGLGDGGPVFGRRTAERLMQRARRRARELATRYGDAGDLAAGADADALWLALHRLEVELDSVSGPAGSASLAGMLDAAEQALATLLARREDGIDGVPP